LFSAFVFKLGNEEAFVMSIVERCLACEADAVGTLGLWPTAAMEYANYKDFAPTERVPAHPYRITAA